ncbi:MAG: DUF1559 domain-containing protein [Planctomycetia bacterium]|nr:DUF1559 domain-containing protein [Planctomycetia bacterium]
MFQKHTRNGFTLVELLVVIAIIGMLVGLLLPAVQQAREAARNMQCQNNIRNMGQACLNAEANYRHYPTGGWGWRWTGDPDRGAGWKQPGGVFYNMLPFLEQTALHQLTASGSSQTSGAQTLMTTPLPMLYCPSRRPAIAYSYPNGTSFWVGSSPSSVSVSTLARSDYAGNGGVSSYESCLDGGSWFLNSYSSSNATESKIREASKNFKGLFGNGTQLTVAEVRDGTSNTILIGEKYLSPDDYSDGTASDDNEGCFIGHNQDITRWAVSQPMQDRPGASVTNIFGGVHSGGFNAVFCDNSTRRVSYSVDLETFQYLCNRSDGKVVDQSGF